MYGIAKLLLPLNSAIPTWDWMSVVCPVRSDGAFLPASLSMTCRAVGTAVLLIPVNRKRQVADA